MINLSKLFYKYVQLLFENLAKRNLENLLNLFDKFDKVLAQTARAVFHSAVMLCVSFPPFAQMMRVVYLKNVNKDYEIMTLRRIKKRYFLDVFELFLSVKYNPS